jgi:chorismate lyase / 3-hydroxybenzoate synthase
VALRYFPDLQIRGQAPGSAHPPPHVLGGAWLGDLPAAPTREWPAQTIPARLPGSLRNSVEEVWACDVPCSAGAFEGINWRRTDGLLYGVLELDESDFSASPAGSPLQAASREAYRRIFSLLEEQRLPNLWRAWNYLADINRESNGLERYRQFNIGRQEAFLEFRHGAAGNVPTACAVGLTGGPLRVAFLAGSEPAEPIENPRQISAYNYPAEYGPSSPTFSRAALVRLPGQELLFVSGTASILGHRTVHPGDVASQTRESLANVAAVVAEANKLSRSGDYGLDELAYRVYLRHADHFASIREALAPSLSPATRITYVQADICRSDLLVEIEGVASHDLENSLR